MTTIAVNAVGFCADFSTQGDWAFDYALSLSRSRGLELKVFYVPDLAWDAGHVTELPPNEVIALDRHVREYYEPKLGDFVDIGFRICQRATDRELRHCLMYHEYQVLVLAYRCVGAKFAGRTTEEFAYALNGPVVLVGPERPDQFAINPAAALLTSQLGLDVARWKVLRPLGTVPAKR